LNPPRTTTHQVAIGRKSAGTKTTIFADSRQLKVELEKRPFFKDKFANAQASTFVFLNAQPTRIKNKKACFIPPHPSPPVF